MVARAAEAGAAPPRDLPADLRLRIEQQELERSLRDARMARLRRAQQRRTVLEAAVLFTVFETLLTYTDGPRALAAIVVGACLGLLWEAIGAGRFLALFTGGIVHGVFRAYFGFGDPFTAFFGALAFFCLAAGLGTSREMRARHF
ncbi:MAG TPA: hypothetical protein PKE00_03525 [Planctomycetota bacterium]|nr:hypothetical protein [Planctomycetota bacterium]